MFSLADFETPHVDFSDFSHHDYISAKTLNVWNKKWIKIDSWEVRISSLIMKSSHEKWKRLKVFFFCLLFSSKNISFKRDREFLQRCWRNLKNVFLLVKQKKIILYVCITILKSEKKQDLLLQVSRLRKREGQKYVNFYGKSWRTKVILKNI